MTGEQAPSFEGIQGCLLADYGIAVTALSRLPLGADVHASVYKAETSDGRSYFVKLKHGGHADFSVAILDWLRALGVQHVIPPIQTTTGKLSQQIDGVTIAVYRFVDGQNGFCCPLTDHQWMTLGKFLRRIHELEVPPAIRDQMRKETYSPKWRDTLRALDIRLDVLDPGDETGLQLREFMRGHRATIRRLVDRAEALSQEVQKQSPACVLCHSDIHAGNVLVAGDGTIYIVDWDEPIMAAKERDLMFIGGGVANVWNQPREEELFYEGYGEPSINRTILAYYRHERIVEDMAVLAKALLLTTSGGDSRQEMYQQFLDQFAPGGVIDIAFETDCGSGW